MLIATWGKRCFSGAGAIGVSENGFTKVCGITRGGHVSWYSQDLGSSDRTYFGRNQCVSFPAWATPVYVSSIYFN